MSPNQRQRFGRNQRLNTRSDYDQVLQHVDIDARSGPIRIYAHKSDADHARLGIIVSKRNVKRAVDRNLVRRIVREWFRGIKSELPPLDIVVSARSLPRSRHTLRQRINKALEECEHSLL